MDPIPAFAALALLTAGLIGQGIEMRRIRRESAPAAPDESSQTPPDPLPQNIFTDRRNIKWYAMIGAGVAVWYYAGGGG